MELGLAIMEGSFATVSVTGMVCEPLPEAAPGAGETVTVPLYVPGNRLLGVTVTVKGVPVVRFVVGETESHAPPVAVVAATVMGIWPVAELAATAVD